MIPFSSKYFYDTDLSKGNIIIFYSINQKHQIKGFIIKYLQAL